MPGTPANSLNLTYAGIVRFDGVSVFSGLGVGNHAVLVGASTNAITSVGPTATAGQILQSAGSSADPVFSTATYPSTAGTSGNVLTSNGTNWTSAAPPASGITGTATQFDVIVGAAGNTVASVGPGSSGQVLQSGGAAANPVYSTATFPATATGTGTILRADGTNWAATTATYPTTTTINRVLFSSSNSVIGEISTGNNGTLVTSNTGVPSILAGPGTAGNILQSNAAAAPSFSTATYPATATTTGQILRADGTNWVGTTATFPDTAGTSGNVLTSNGTNWASSAAPAGNLLIATKTLTSAQVKLLNATPIEIVAAPGSGKGILVLGVATKLNYGGTNVFTAGAAQSIQLFYNNSTTQLLVLLGNAMLVSAASKFSYIQAFTALTNQSAGVLDNVNIAAKNPVATEISGNAAGDNTVDIILTYVIVTF